MGDSKPIYGVHLTLQFTSGRPSTSASAHWSDERSGHALEGKTGGIVPSNEYTERLCAWREPRHVGVVCLTCRERQLDEKHELAADERCAQIRGAAAHSNP